VGSAFGLAGFAGAFRRHPEGRLVPVQPHASQNAPCIHGGRAGHGIAVPGALVAQDFLADPGAGADGLHDLNPSVIALEIMFGANEYGGSLAHPCAGVKKSWSTTKLLSEPFL